jgi:uncharacterized protein
MTLQHPAEWGLIFIGGLLGSAHCLGMCGGIALMMNRGAASWREAGQRQLAWSLGRIATYVFLGTAAAAMGARIIRSQAETVRIQALLAIFAGLLLLLEGLRSAGWMPVRWHRRNSPPCILRTVFSGFLAGGSNAAAFVAGLATGFLPCGLVYSFLTLAAGTAHPGLGAAVMACFGLGTMPALLTTITGLTAAPWQWRQKVLRIAALSVLATGLLTTLRGVHVLSSHPGEESDSPACPLCVDGNRGNQ